MTAVNVSAEEAFLKDVKPQLEVIEAVREEKYASYVWRRKVGSMIALVLTPITGFIDYMLLFVWSANADDSAAGLTLALLAGIYAWVTVPKRAYIRVYKEKIMPMIAALMGLTYDIDGQFDLSRHQVTKILPKYDRADKEDSFRGTYKGAELAFAEINLKQKRRSRKRTHYVSVFKGLAIHIVLPEKKFFGHTIVRADQAGLFEWMQEASTDLKRADLVDPVFEKKYSVFTNDQMEARYLLHPAMIERINNVEQSSKSNEITLSCRKSELFMLISTKKNFFEPPDISMPATDLDGLRSLKRDVDMTLGFIDHFEFWEPELPPEDQQKKVEHAKILPAT